MNDVAREVGVSAKTVSRVVNDDAHVSPATAARINDAIERLGFRRNESARLLRQGTASTIGLLLEDVSDPFYGALTRAVEESVLAHDHQLLVSSSAEDAHRADRLIAAFVSRGVGGLILAPATGLDEKLLADERAKNCPVVAFDRPLEELDVDTVLADNRGGTIAGVRHLIERGHRRIAFFGDADSVYTARERRAGYRDALADAGIPFDPELVLMLQPDERAGTEALGMLAASADPPTAVFAGNNRWSVQLLRALVRHPIGLAYVGFDDFELADVVQPGVTVVTQDPAAMGRVAADLLFRRIDGDDGPAQRVQLSTALIERGSGERLGPFVG
ncbi:LacI family transcriptional regulator [Humibacter ginsenosidimutans]|uniref:LacI family transcriptional regulator n=1 Tax=Humibacter ginsenosidimutans TaxID=2599293 RepID=A0A5B8M638_9MICO|nr:LacI family transcriptional regulator [Humibacter ginsenosidimutans]